MGYRIDGKGSFYAEGSGDVEDALVLFVSESHLLFLAQLVILAHHLSVLIFFELGHTCIKLSLIEVMLPVGGDWSESKFSRGEAV